MLRQLLPLMMLKHIIRSNFKRLNSRVSTPSRESRLLKRVGSTQGYASGNLSGHFQGR